MKRFTNIEDKIYPFFFIVIIVVIWQISLINELIDNYILPYPFDVLRTIFEVREELIDHLLVTLKEAVLGLIIAVIFSIIIAFLMDKFTLIKKALFPILLISQMIPVVLLAPLFSLWFGLTIVPKIIVVVLICFFPIVVNLSQGLENVDNDQINLLKSMGASGMQIFKIVKLPSTIINFFSGLKVAATYSFMGAVISEWMGGAKGIGIYYLRAKKSFDINRVFASVFVIILMSVLIYGLVAKLQKIVVPLKKIKIDGG
jgi:ABC-type nitrate/sulfonate/bicarbonate transport system permease component